MAFSLITFMIGEVVLIEKAIRCPLDTDKFQELNEEDFLNLKSHLLQILGDTEVVELDEFDSVLLYLLVDIACKCFVSDSNLILEQRANDIMEIPKEEYNQVRHSYIHYAQSLINEMNTKFEKSPAFINVRARLAE